MHSIAICCCNCYSYILGLCILYRTVLPKRFWVSLRLILAVAFHNRYLLLQLLLIHTCLCVYCTVYCKVLPKIVIVSWSHVRVWCALWLILAATSTSRIMLYCIVICNWVLCGDLHVCLIWFGLILVGKNGICFAVLGFASRLSLRNSQRRPPTVCIRCSYYRKRALPGTVLARSSCRVYAKHTSIYHTILQNHINNTFSWIYLSPIIQSRKISYTVFV